MNEFVKNVPMLTFRWVVILFRKIRDDGRGLFPIQNI